MPACREEIERVYSRLDVTFDHTMGESCYQPLLAGVVDDLTARGMARESRGAVGGTFYPHHAGGGGDVRQGGHDSLGRNRGGQAA